MTEIIVIAAVANKNAIGINNEIPWHIKEDFEYFKEKTLGSPCIMGDKTYESLPDFARPLPDRENIVLTFDKDYHPENTTVLNDFNEAIQYVKDKGVKKAFIIGGATIYRLGVEVADTLLITHIDKDCEADTFFPEIEETEWNKVSEEQHEGIDIKTKEKLKYTFTRYERK